MTSPGINHDLRQMADQLEQLTQVTVAAEGRVRMRIQGADETEAKKLIASDPQVRLLRAAKEQMRSELIRIAPNHPVYNWGMGIPGINLFLLCKLAGMIRMDGPNCLSCGTAMNTLRDKVVCWSCHDVPSAPGVKAGAKCTAALPVPDGGKAKKCGHILTKSKFVLQCPDCGHLQHDFPNFSQLRTFCGHTPGKNRVMKGQPSPYSLRLRTYCYQAFECLIKVGGRYRKKPVDDQPDRLYVELYDQWRIKYAEREGVGSQGKKWLESRDLYDPARFPGYKKMTDYAESAGTGKKGKKRPEFPDIRQHFMAKNKVMDVFLYHMWFTWRDSQGWPTREPYPIEHQEGHQTLIPASEFTSTDMAERKHQAALRDGSNIDRQVQELLAQLRDGDDEELAAAAGIAGEAE